MSVIIKTSEMQYKDTNGVYHGVNAIAEKKIADQVADLDAAIYARESRIATNVSQMQAAVDDIESQRQTMIASIASVAGQGTDTTLTQSGVAADAKAVGDKVSDLSALSIVCSTEFSPIVTIPDGADNLPVKTLTVGIEPVQDLHGYDNPWPAGGGKNLLNNTATTTTDKDVTFTVNSDGTVSTSGTADGTAVLRIYQTFSATSDLIISGCPSGGGITTSYSVIVADSTGARIGSVDTGSGGTITAENVSRIAQIQIIVRDGTNVNGKVFKPMIRLASVSDDTFAPYSNICPISVWTGCEVNRTGKNLYNKAITGDSGKYINANGNLSNSANYTASGFQKVVPDTDIVISGVGANSTNIRTAFYSTNSTGSFISAVTQADNSFTTHVPQNAHYCRISIRSGSEDAVQIELGSTASAFEAYAGETIEYTFPSEAGTVYGGTLTIHQDGSGELVVDKASLNLGTVVWRYLENASHTKHYFRMLNEVSDMKPSSGNSIIQNVITSQYKAATWTSTVDDIEYDSCVCVGWKDKSYLAIADSRYNNETDFKTAMSGVQLVYELATPVTYQLTNQQVIELLKGNNNIWADTGDVAIEYPADTKLYIDGKIAELQALILENISNS